MSWHFPLGRINGHALCRVPSFRDPRLGASRGLPFAMRFRIAPDATGFPGGIGARVHRKRFAGLPPFTVSVVFACAAPDLLGRSGYADPASIWCNAFTGYYQVDVLQSEWDHPFAYHLDGQGRSAPRLDELSRLAQADWNRLSGQVYGIPEAAIARVEALGDEGLGAQHPGRVRLEGWERPWDSCSFEGLRVTSPCSAQRGRDYQDLGPLCGRLWRLSFGRFRGAAPESFAPMLLRMRAYLSWTAAVDGEGRPVFRTFVFGGACNAAYDRIDAAENARFLDLQMAALADVIRRERGLGFGPGQGALPAAQEAAA